MDLIWWWKNSVAAITTSYALIYYHYYYIKHTHTHTLYTHFYTHSSHYTSVCVCLCARARARLLYTFFFLLLNDPRPRAATKTGVCARIRSSLVSVAFRAARALAPIIVSCTRVRRRSVLRVSRAPVRPAAAGVQCEPTNDTVCTHTPVQ